jgi:hypothetical protein
VALAADAPSNLGDIWEQMCRVTYKTLRFYTGLAGNPITWADHYTLSDDPFDTPRPRLMLANGQPAPEMYDVGENRLADITDKGEVLTAETNPFPVKYGIRDTKMFFNFSEYCHLLLSDFMAAGGKIVMRDFHSPNELAHLPEKVIINCPGYAAHDWWRDKSMMPVRGQTEWLIPQPEVKYGLTYRGVETRSKSDGVMVIDVSPARFVRSWNNSDENPNRAEADNAVKVVAELMSRFRPA